VIGLLVTACIAVLPGQCADIGMTFVGSTVLDSSSVTDLRHAVVSGAEFGVVIGLFPSECPVC
jgi:hypothetical protein